MKLYLLTQTKIIGNGDGTICDSMVVAAKSKAEAQFIKPSKIGSWPDVPEDVVAIWIGYASPKVKPGIVLTSWC